KMPEHFVLGHPIGTILGNADYGDFLVVFQGVTVNTAQDQAGGCAPHLGCGLFLGAHAKIIGNQTIGNRVSIGVDTTIYGCNVPDDTIAITDAGGKTVIRPRMKPQCKAQDYFNIPICS
ncbi:MAG: hypothetical protein RSB18_10275, partial [Clostridia bacterium]